MRTPLVTALVAAALWLLSAAGPSAAAAHRPRGAAVTVTVGATGGVVPKSFLGIATEYLSVPIYERNIRAFDRMLALLRPPEGGPLVVRFGGLSADHALWTPALTAAVPPLAYALTPADLEQIAAIVRTDRLQAILDLNLAADDPAAEAQLAAAAQGDFPSGSIDAFEIGNEPDYYHYTLRGNPAYYPTTYTPDLYASRFSEYRQALATAGVRAPLAGPALANPIAHYDYLTRVVGDNPGSVGMLTVHRYPLSACAFPGSPLFPTITRLLRNSASIGLIHSLARSVAFAHSSRVPIRLDELNSVTCGGTLGVSDSFASALWATDTLFAAAASGLDGVNVQLRPDALNAPILFTAAGAEPRPLMYGMLLFDRALGRGSRMAATSVSEPRALAVNVWAVRQPSGALSVVALNKGTSRAVVRIRAPRGPVAGVEQMLASSLLTESRVTLAGQRIGADGRWRGRRVVGRVSWHDGGYSLVVPALSGALVSIP
jgi:hypothetical protein